ncbi:MAG: hypothetical protein V4537_17620 [Pseudomonadota bacterium]
MARAALCGLVALTLTGCATTQADPAARDAAELADMIGGRSAGKAQRCIGLTSATGPTIAGTSLVYRDGRRLWVSRPIDGCPTLRGDPITIVEMTGSQLCAGDRFRTIERGGIGIPGPYCRFGPFVPWEKARR